MFAEFMQLMLCFRAQDARCTFGRCCRVGNLHLDPDSANLATPVLQFGHYFRRKLPQFCSNCAVGSSDAERALVQTCHLTALCEIGWRRMAEVLLQFCQGRRCVKQVAQLRIVAHQGF